MGSLSSIDDAILEPLENIFDALGMMQGDLDPLKRAAVGGAIGYGLAYGLKPNFAFDGNTPRPWKVTASADEQKDATWFPAWAIAALPAFVFGVLI